MVCKGSVGSQVSIQLGVGAKPPGIVGEVIEVSWLGESDVMLL